MSKVDYSDSEKFRAELHKFMGLSFMTPLSLNILNLLVFNGETSYSSVFFEVILFIVGYLTTNNSHEIMRLRDIKNSQGHAV